MSVETNKIICGDCLSVMEGMPDGCVDIVVTSPPYNLLNSSSSGLKRKNSKWGNNKLKKGYDGYGDDIPEKEYIEWQRSCLTQMMRLIKDDGAIFYNHKWRVQNGLLQNNNEIVDDFPVRQIIIWHRNGGTNFNKTYFLPTYEIIYLIAKNKFELVSKASHYTDVWNVSAEINNEHPAPFPLEIPRRCIISTNAKVVLDPFVGSGTTAVVCKMLGREYIGIDQSSKYCEMARSRLVEQTEQLYIF